MPRLLAAWREAERRWERLAPPEEVHAAALDVVRAWADYQDGALPADTQEFMLAADDDGRYVAATGGVRQVLGYEPVDLIGMTVADLAAPELREQTPQEWSRFLADGRQEGVFRLCTTHGQPVDLVYQARAHHPVPGFHVSRLWPTTEG